MTKKFNLYIGKAGHLTVMSEFLMRGWNVAIPEVDIGDDIFVVQDEIGTLNRVQVKTATAINKTSGFSAKFNLSIKQLEKTTDIFIQYVFVVRYNEKWTTPLIIRQDILLNHFQINNLGSKHDGSLILHFSYSENKVECSGQDFTKYIADYTDFPIIEH